MTLRNARSNDEERHVVVVGSFLITNPRKSSPAVMSISHESSCYKHIFVALARLYCDLKVRIYIYLFICGLYNAAASNLNCTVELISSS